MHKLATNRRDFRVAGIAVEVGSEIIEYRLSHRRTKEIFHHPTNFLAKWPCAKKKNAAWREGLEKQKQKRRRAKPSRHNADRELEPEELKTRCRAAVRAINIIIITGTVAARLMTGYYRTFLTSDRNIWKACFIISIRTRVEYVSG